MMGTKVGDFFGMGKGSYTDRLLFGVALFFRGFVGIIPFLFNFNLSD